MQDFWNERYRQTTFAYGKAPNNYFAQQLAQLPPGKMLLPCEGEGRNAAYAAQKGWQVDAFDFSKAGKTKAEQLAGSQLMQRIHYQVADAKNYQPPKASYDLIGLFFTHLPPEWRMDFFHRLPPALKPQGLLVAEVFHPDQVGKASGGPPNPAMMFTLDDARQAFPGLAMEELCHQQVELEEGPYHSGLADVLRIRARKR